MCLCTLYFAKLHPETEYKQGTTVKSPVARPTAPIDGYSAACMQLLGRADEIKDYIRKGTNEAMTEITLSSGNPQRLIVVYRRINREGSRFKINGERLTVAAKWHPQCVLFDRHVAST